MTITAPARHPIPMRFSHEDERTGRVSYLGTGIANLEAAKRDLRRKYGSKPMPSVERRLGARFYVTARRGKRTAYLLGPYVSHMTAMDHVEDGKALLREVFPHEEFLAVGTASRPDTVTTTFGR